VASPACLEGGVGQAPSAGRAGGASLARVGLAGSIRAVNYALYCAALAGAVLIAVDLAHPTNLASEGRRVLFTFAGVGIAVIVMFLAGLLQKRTAKAVPSAAPASTM
jgi:hypothetical protein